MFYLGRDKTQIINIHKNKRLDAQYYMKVGKKEEINAMLREAKTFVSTFDELISNLDEKKIKDYRNKLI